MKKLTHTTFRITLFCVAFANALWAQGVFTSAATGSWSTPSTWTLSSGTDADGIPDADDNVTIGAHVVTVTAATEACNNLTITTPNTNRLALGVNTLEVNGTLSHGVAPTSDLYITSTSEMGRIKFVGGSRALFTTSAAFGNGYDVEVAISGTGTASTNLKFRNFYVTSGTFNITGELRIDGGANGLGKLIISSGGTLIGSSNIGVRSGTASSYCGTVQVDGTLETSALRLNGLSVTINGTLRIKNASGLSVSDPSSALDPEFSYGPASAVEYASAANTSMGVETGRASSTADPIINEVKINIPAANSVSSNFKLPQIKTLTFIGGKLNANSLITIVDGGTISGASSSSYVITAGSGALKRKSIGSTITEFPVGPSASLYHPATIANNGTIDDYTIKVASAAPTCVNALHSVTTNWDIAEALAGGSICDLTFDYTGAATGASYSAATAQIVHCNGSTLDYSNGSVTGTVASGTGFTTFSPFGISSDPIALPIELRAFTGKNVGRSNMLEWETQTEKNVEAHIVERSGDGIHWVEIGRRAGQEFSTVLVHYDLEDKQPLAKAYYRLRSVDFDGAASLSGTILLTRPGSQFEIMTAFPTPTRDRLTVQFAAQTEASVTIHVMDINGRVVWSQQADAGKGINETQLELTSLPNGVYTVTIANGAAVTAPLRIVKE